MRLRKTLIAFAVSVLVALTVSFTLMSQPDNDLPEDSTNVPTNASTASDNVVVIEDLVMPHNGAKRTVRVYVPKLHQTHPDKTYPVVYMHDGQNIFDDATSYVGEWHVDEILDKHAQSGKAVPIVVAIDHGNDKRLQELGPWDHDEYGESLASEYLAFLLDVVKPYVEANFPAAKGPQNTAIMGSSMGGLMSYYAVHTYPEVFSKAGVFSPSFWYSEQVFVLADAKPLQPGQRIYSIVGLQEGENMVPNWQRMDQLYTAQGINEKQYKALLVTDGQHNEAFWSAHYLNALLWLFKNENS
ncbi:alpha/beta hydrolase [Alteromonas facilis]|uniref:alpha/beta hydrolase n=1 Tax=Alteromonas facilis TaxID=2048004 RepID=UPI000F5D003A|nr:alpha/beta hydrolase-fold protein [Alteromonas facilis]